MEQQQQQIKHNKFKNLRDKVQKLNSVCVCCDGCCSGSAEQCSKALLDVLELRSTPGARHKQTQILEPPYHGSADKVFDCKKTIGFHDYLRPCRHKLAKNDIVHIS